MRSAERQTRRGVCENPVSDRALPAAADFVIARRRVDERAAEILPACERPFDSEARANLAARRQRPAPLERRVARTVAVARSRANCPVGPHLERRRESRGHPTARSETRRRESEQIGRGRTEQRNRGVGDGGGTRGNRADEIEDETPRNNANRCAKIGVDQPGVIDRGAADVGGRADEGSPDIDRQAIADSLGDADRNREFTDLAERESGAEAIGFEKRPGARDGGPGLRGQYPRQQGESHQPARGRHGSLKMIRITPKVWTTFVTPWLSFVG